VDGLRNLGHACELRAGRGADPQAILRAALALGPVFAFEITQPSLHDIFVRIAGPSSPEVPRA
jgi:ABC-type uncharacterized transport system ATPase subunit